MKLSFKADPIDQTLTIYSKDKGFRLVLSSNDLKQMDQARGFATDPAVQSIMKGTSDARSSDQPSRSTNRG